jgi:hypothetical protein
MQIPRFRCKMTLHLIPEPEEKASELLRDLTANDSKRHLPARPGSTGTAAPGSGQEISGLALARTPG